MATNDSQCGLTSAEAEAEFGWCQKTVAIVAKLPSPALDGRCVRTWKERREYPKRPNGLPVPVYSYADLRAIYDSDPATWNWITAGDVENEYPPIKRRRIGDWRREGRCPILDKPMRCQKMVVPSACGYFSIEWRYHRADVEKAQQKLVSAPDDDRMTDAEAELELQIRRASRYAKKPAAALGRTISRTNGYRVDKSGTPRRVGQSPAKDLKQIAEFNPPVTPPWLPRPWCEDNLGLKEKTVAKWRFDEWCPSLGRMMREKKKPTRMRDGKRSREVWHIHWDDAFAAARALKTKPDEVLERLRASLSAPAADHQTRVAPLEENVQQQPKPAPDAAADRQETRGDAQTAANKPGYWKKPTNAAIEAEIRRLGFEASNREIVRSYATRNARAIGEGDLERIDLAKVRIVKANMKRRLKAGKRAL